MNSYFERHRGLRDILSIILFIIAVIVGSWLINLFLFRSFSVVGPSMEPTFYTGHRVIVNRLAVTIDHIQGKAYQPARGQIIVFKNPTVDPPSTILYSQPIDEYIVKRVIALPGERVVLENGVYTVYNSENPDGFNPDSLTQGPQGPTDGDVDRIVPGGHIFVSGDHRQEGYSLDSRNGLGTIPLEQVVGPVALRIFPFTQLRTY